jgi:hypothetical protein
VKPVWSDDLSGRSLEEVLLFEAENRAWSKALRGQVTALVDSRLTKRISLEVYSKSRQHGNEDADECKRRGIILAGEIGSRHGHALPHAKP